MTHIDYIWCSISNQGSGEPSGVMNGKELNEWICVVGVDLSPGLGGFSCGDLSVQCSSLTTAEVSRSYLRQLGIELEGDD